MPTPLATINDQTVLITARHPGQVIFLNGEVVDTSIFSEQVLRAYGTGEVELGWGWWDNLVIAEGRYDGGYFDGETSPDPDLTPSWTGTPNASASILTYIPVIEVFNGWSTDQWSASGERSLRVPETLQASGRNYLLNSATYNDVQTNSSVDSPIATGTDEIGNWITGTEASSGLFALSTYTRPTFEVGAGSQFSEDIMPLPDVLTQSVELMSDTSMTVLLSNWTDPVDLEPGVWTRVSYTITPSSPSSERTRMRGPAVDPTSDVPVGTKLYHRNWKLEIGDTATDWSPAPEDVAIVNLADDQRFSIVARDAGQQVFRDGILRYTTKRSNETVVVKSPGYVVLGEGYWDNGMVVRKDYDGPYFDGDTPPFRYHGQVVRPAWMEGDPGLAKSQLADYYEVEPWKPTAEWSKSENRRYSIGADRGMLYRNGLGVPWSGLVSVNRNGNDSEVGKRYLDGVLFNVSVPPSDFSASLEAFTYPDEFDACIGNANYNGVEGLTVHGQESEPFDLCYRTQQGDGNGHGEDYILHFVYGCMAVDSGHDHASINDSPEAETFSFEIHGVPQAVPNARPSAYFSIDSRKVNRGLLEGLEQALYGTNGAQPRLPTMGEIETYFA